MRTSRAKSYGWNISQSRPIYTTENLGADPSRNRRKVPESDNKMKAFPQNTKEVRGVLLVIVKRNQCLVVFVKRTKLLVLNWSSGCLFSDSGLYLLNGFDYNFDLFWMAWLWKPAIVLPLPHTFSRRLHVICWYANNEISMNSLMEVEIA